MVDVQSFTKTKKDFFMKISHKMEHVKILPCILFEVNFRGRLGLTAILVKMIKET